MTKVRGIVVVDMDIEGGFRNCAKAEEALENVIKDYVRGNANIVHWQVEMAQVATGEPLGPPICLQRGHS